jgi:hypothetical protein
VRIYYGRRDRVLADIDAERDAQDAKWGVQNHRNGTGTARQRMQANTARKVCDDAALIGIVSWANILDEEVAEAEAERDPAALRVELVQSAAVIVAWIECLDRTAANLDRLRGEKEMREALQRSVA